MAGEVPEAMRDEFKSMAEAIMREETRQDDAKLAQRRAAFIEETNKILPVKRKWDIAGRFDDPTTEGYAERLADRLVVILKRFERGWFCSIDCGPGWWRFLVDLDEQIGALCPDYQIHQIKEKFGTLRYYYGGGTLLPGLDHRIAQLIVGDLVGYAELKSARTCEVCGKDGRVFSDKGWYRCACHDHGHPELKDDE